MLPVVTEELHAQAQGLEARPLGEVAELLVQAQALAAATVQVASPQICAGAVAMADSLRSEGRIWYVAAGSSGLMAAADALELGGTFGIKPQQIRILMAGGLPSAAEMPGETEDDVSELSVALAELTAKDTVIAVSASGSTPYTLAATHQARDVGATTIGLANNSNSALLMASDHAILLPTAPEVLSGSTRMGAGTAQKIALNTLSTLMALELGHVHDGMMVNLRADNAKLRLRARGIVARIARVDEVAAAAALAQANGSVKPAILLAAGAQTVADAQALLIENRGHIGPALAAVRPKKPEQKNYKSKHRED